MKWICTILVGLSFLADTAFASSPDWSEGYEMVRGENRANIYQIENVSEFNRVKENGLVHAMVYPVSVTGLLVPYRPLINFFKTDDQNPLRKLLLTLSENYTGFKSEKELYEWLGLAPLNPPTATGIYKMPYPNGKIDQFYAGAGLMKTKDGEGLTFSCFACHAQSMFGVTVMGLTNKRPHANKFFHRARKSVPLIPNTLFKLSTNASAGEVEMFNRTKKNLVSVSATEPQVLGLDTSLPQVALSLARRNDDAYATKNPILEKFPRHNELEDFVADSKPLPWWNLKYKTRWLADGSIVSGNPILTNFLWNEIGRGTDLVELEKWMKENQQTIDELTAAAFSTEAPQWSDFLPVEKIYLERAKKGEVYFNQTCLKCHGEYVKAWSQPESSALSAREQIKTIQVIYPEKTTNYNVGTDPQRFMGIKYFADDLNNLSISKWMKTKVVPQDGYVPPPLVGIWARYPYLHNNSIPNLCALLTAPEERPKTFYQGPAINPETDFDQECVGYPVGSKIPVSWKKDKEAFFNTEKKGLRNTGHYKMLLDKNGNELYTDEQKMDLIHFLKTL